MNAKRTSVASDGPGATSRTIDNVDDALHVHGIHLHRQTEPVMLSGPATGILPGPVHTFAVRAVAAADGTVYIEVKDLQPFREENRVAVERVLQMANNSALLHERGKRWMRFLTSRPGKGSQHFTVSAALAVTPLPGSTSASAERCYQKVGLAIGQVRAVWPRLGDIAGRPSR